MAVMSHQFLSLSRIYCCELVLEKISCGKQTDGHQSVVTIGMTPFDGKGRQGILRHPYIKAHTYGNYLNMSQYLYIYPWACCSILRHH